MAGSTAAQIATVNHPHGNIKIPCSDCHSTKAWKPLRLDIKFQHEKTGFVLQGQHALVDCKRCHASLKFTGAAKDCKACHSDPHDGTLGKDCERCHTFQAWADISKITLVHQASRFPLVGRHQHVGCAGCHAAGGQSQFVNLPLQCSGCHQQDYEATTAPNHKLAGFSLRCETCHSSAITAWADARFTHVASFPLTLGHGRATCAECHAAGFRGTSSACISCHQKDYQATTNPNHVALGYSTDCRSCHTTQDWRGQAVDHSFFPLVGAHASAGCNACHGNGVFRGTPRDCFSCHQQDFTSVTNPNHVAGKFSHTCTQCHTTNVWKPSTFDHNRTAFALVGAHQAVDCARCHANGMFAGTPKDCFSCHQQDFTSVTNPNHVAGNYSHDCLVCHNSSAWRPATFDHNRTTFPLVGAHQTVDCARCHANGQYTGTPKDCFSCHQTDFQNTTNPNHVAGNYSHDCQSCHSNVAWQPATFDHNRTRFSLAGAHLAVACNQCHVNNQYTGTPMDCYSCHQNDFQLTTNPNHIAADFSRTCTDCHTVNAWKPSTFDHNTTRFPLLGAHVATACGQCHVNNRFAGTPTDCYSCHQSDFQRPTNPNHVTLNFAHDCTMCHTLNAWLPATFDHDGQYFRIYSGKHRGKWQTCATCHVNAANYKVFECIFCHEHDKTKMDDKHRNRPDYQYNSQACYNCHPRV